jgi:hypothetical protein
MGGGISPLNKRRHVNGSQKKMTGLQTLFYSRTTLFDRMGRGSSTDLVANNISTLNGTSYIAPALAGCIDYQFQNSSRHHQTSFVFEIVRADNRTRIFVLGQAMSADKMILIRDAQYDRAD